MTEHISNDLDEHAEEASLLPIGEVSMLTGVNAVTLRAWQRRFGLVIPLRTPKGHRLYTAQNIQEIHEINAWLAKGVAISKVKPLLQSAVKSSAVGSLGTEDIWSGQIGELLTALFELNQQRLHQILDESLGLYPFQLVKQKLFQPWFSQLETLLDKRLDAELLLAWLKSELTSRIGGRQSFAGQASCAQVALVRLPQNASAQQANLTNRLYYLILCLELAQLRVSVINLGMQETSRLGLLNDRLKVDALLLIPEANHAPSKQSELQTLLEQMPIHCYLIGPFAPTFTELSRFIAPDVSELIDHIAAVREQNKKLSRRQKSLASEDKVDGEHDDIR